MKNTKELRSQLSELFTEVKEKAIDPKIANALVKVSNSMLKSASLEMEHSKMTKSNKEIEFLKTE
jgi:transposase-like protein